MDNLSLNFKDVTIHREIVIVYCELCQCEIGMSNSVANPSLKSTRCCSGTIYTLSGCFKINFRGVHMATSTRDNLIRQSFDETLPQRFPQTLEIGKLALC